jgi:hypothetical protein
MTTKRIRRIDPLAEELRSQVEEIKKYKWIESEKAGRDIGWDKAANEWMQTHFPAWKRHRWNRALKQALQNESTANGLN